MLTHIDGFSSNDPSSPGYSIDWHLLEALDPGCRSDILSIKKGFDEEVLLLAGRYQSAMRFQFSGLENAATVIRQLESRIVNAETRISNVLYRDQKIVESRVVKSRSLVSVDSIHIKRSTKKGNILIAVNEDFENLLQGHTKSRNWNFVADIASIGEEGIRVSLEHAKILRTYLNSDPKNPIYLTGRYSKTSIIGIRRDRFLREKEANAFSRIPIYLLTDIQWRNKIRKASLS